jgi:ferric-dicitrate binding protein FerR (iron transport regulator)
MDTKENNLSPEILISGYLKGELDPEEVKELMSWIKSDPSNKRKFDEYCEIWITARSGVKHPEYNFHEGFWKFKQQIGMTDQASVNSSKKRLYFNFLKYAAVFILAASLSGLLFYYLGKNNARSQYNSVNELIVPMGSSAKFNLSDGTTVTLNAGSRLTYDNCFGLDDRSVTLEGEAFFNVAKESDKPFIVRTSHINIKALGTAFNVKAYSSDKTIETTLVEGSVKIEGISAEGSSEVTVLKPNQKLTFYKEDLTIVDETAVKEDKQEKNVQPEQVLKPASIPRVITENVNVEPVISWKENKWIFEKQSLEQIAIELERKYDVRIIFESERLKYYRFTGIILAEPIEQVLEVMSITAPINFRLKGNVVTLSENKDFIEVNKDLYVKPE